MVKDKSYLEKSANKLIKKQQEQEKLKELDIDMTKTIKSIRL